MTKPQIMIGNPHALGKRAAIELAGCIIVVPLDTYDNAIDAVLSQLAITVASMAGAMVDLQAVIATLAPRDAGLLVHRDPDVQAAIDRIHDAVDRRTPPADPAAS